MHLLLLVTVCELSAAASFVCAIDNGSMLDTVLACPPGNVITSITEAQYGSLEVKGCSCAVFPGTVDGSRGACSYAPVDDGCGVCAPCGGSLEADDVSCARMPLYAISILSHLSIQNCVGRQSCTVDAPLGACGLAGGDPCPGSRKRTLIQGYCDAPGHYVNGLFTEKFDSERIEHAGTSSPLVTCPAGEVLTSIQAYWGSFDVSDCGGFGGTVHTSTGPWCTVVGVDSNGCECAYGTYPRCEMGACPYGTPRYVTAVTTWAPIQACIGQSSCAVPTEALRSCGVASTDPCWNAAAPKRLLVQGYCRAPATTSAVVAAANDKQHGATGDVVVPRQPVGRMVGRGVSSTPSLSPSATPSTSPCSFYATYRFNVGGTGSTACSQTTLVATAGQVGSVGAASGYVNTAASFGSTAYYQFPYAWAYSGAGSFTVTVWAYASTNSGSYQAPLAFASANATMNTGWMIVANTAFQWEFWTAVSGTTWSKSTYARTLAANTWYHLAGVYDRSGQMQYFYINGVLVSSTSSVANVVAATPDLFVTVGSGLGTSYSFLGAVEDASFFTSVATQRQIYCDYLFARYYFTLLSTGATPPCANTVSLSPAYTNATITTAYSRSFRAAVFPTPAAVSAPGACAAYTGVAGFEAASSFSVEFWLKANATASDWMSPVTNRPPSVFILTGWAFYVGTDLSLQFWLAHQTDWKMAIYHNITLRTWYHVVGTYDNNTRGMQLFVDGALASYQVLDSTIATNPDGAGVLTIGCGVSGFYRFQGSVQDVAIYGRAVTAADVRCMFVAPTYRFSIAGGTVPLCGSTTVVSPAVTAGSPGTTSGYHSSTAAYFSSSSQYYSYTYSSAYQLTTSFSICFWARTDTLNTGGFQCPICMRNTAGEGSAVGWVFYIDPSNVWAFWMAVPTVSWAQCIDDVRVTAGVWYFVCGVYWADTQTAQLYVDTSMRANTTVSNFLTATDPVLVGIGIDNNYSWKGGLEDVSYYNFALTPAQLQAEYSQPSFLGSYNVTSGPAYLSGPATYTCVAACAYLFPGRTDYHCSQSSDSVSYKAYYSCWSGGCQTFDENYSNGGTYAVGICSAYVADNCGSSTNYCWGGHMTSTSPTPSITPSNTPSGSRSQPASPSQTPSLSQPASASQTPSSSQPASASQTASQSQPASASQTPSLSQPASATQTPSSSQPPSASQTPSPSQSATASQTPSLSQPPSTSQTPSLSQPASVTQTPSTSQPASASQTPSLSQPPSASQTPSLSQPASATQTPSTSQPASQTQTPTASQSVSASQTSSTSQPASASQTASTSQPPSLSQTPSLSQPASASQTPSASQPPSASQTPSLSQPASASQTPSLSQPPSSSETPSLSQPASASQTPSLSQPASASETASLSQPPSASQTPSPSQPASVTQTPSSSQPPSDTETPSVSQPASATQTPSRSQPASASQTSSTSQPASPTETPSLSRLSSASQTPSTSQPASVTQTPSSSQPASASQTPSGSQPASESQTASVSQPASATGTASTSQPGSASQTPSASQPASVTQTPSSSLPASASQTASGSQPVSVSQTPSSSQPTSPSQTASTSQPASDTQTPSNSQASSASQTPSGSQPASATPTASSSQPASQTQTSSSSQPASASQTATVSQPASSSQTASSSQPASASQTSSTSQPASSTQTVSASQTASGSQPASNTQTPSSTQPASSSQTATVSSGASASSTASATQPASVTATPTASTTGSTTVSPSQPATASQTASVSQPASVSQTASSSQPVTASQTASATQPATASQTASTSQPASASQTASTTQPATASQTASTSQPASASQTASTTQPATASQTASPSQPASASQTASTTQPATASQTASTSQPASASQTVSTSQPGSPSQTASTSQPASVTPTPSGSATLSHSLSGTASVTSGASASESVSVSLTASASVSRSLTASGLVSSEASGSATVSLSVGLSASRTATMSTTASASATSAASVTGSKSLTSSTSSTASVSPTVSQTPSTSVSATPSQTPSTSGSTSFTASVTASESLSSSNTPTRTSSKSPSKTRTGSVTSGASVTATNSLTLTPTSVPTESPTASVSATASVSRSAPSSRTPSRTASVTRSQTRSASPSPSSTTSTSSSPSASVTPSRSASATTSPSLSPSVTPSISDSPSTGASQSSSTSGSQTPSASVSTSASASASSSASITPSTSGTPSNTATTTATPTNSPIVCPASCATCVDDDTCTTCKSDHASPVGGANAGPCMCNVGYYGNNVTCTACDTSCNPSVGCTGPASVNCKQCNEAQSYTLNFVGDACTQLPCPTGQYNDVSGGAGAHRCGIFGLKLTCFNSPCHTVTDNSVSAIINVALTLRPSANVRVALLLSNNDIAALSVSVVDLSPEAYATGVNVTVNGVSDYYAHGINSYYVSASVQYTADLRYNVATPQLIGLISVSVDGSDSAPFQYIILGSPLLYEGGSSVSIAVAMTFDPLLLQAASVGVVGSVTNVNVSPQLLSFSTYNWLSLQVITVTAPRNWIDEGNSTFNVSLTFRSTGRVMFATLNYIELDHAGVAAVPLAALYTDQLGLRSPLSLALTSRPINDVAVTVVVSPTAEATVVGSSVFKFTASNWNTPVSAVIAGVRTPPDGTINAGVPFTVTVSSAAAVEGMIVNQYEKRTWNTLTGTNQHLVFPVVSGLTPALSPLLGGWNVTASGSNILAGCSVNVSQTDGYSVAAPYVVVDVAAQTVLFTTPDQFRLGYATVRLTNTDGGYGELTNTLFVTNDCPVVGQFGQGKSCVSCPTGAYCPGGNRMWPLEGFWTPSESAGYVVACPNPPSRCPAWGSADQSCSSGYAGPRCAQCAQGYYLFGDTCIECGSTNVITALLIVDGAFIVVLTALMLVLPSPALRAVVLVVSALQGIRAVGQMASSRMPAGLVAIYQYLALTSIDISFLRSSCTSFGSGYFVVFWGNLLLIGACTVPLIAMSFLLAIIRWHRKEYHLNRLVRGLTVYASMFYLVVCTRAFQAVYCQSDGASELVLVFDYSTPCFSGNEFTVTVAGYVLVALVVLGYPVGMTSYLYRLKRNGMLDQKGVLERFGYIYAGFKTQRLFFAAMGYAELMLLALAATIGSSVENVQSALSALAFGSMTLMLILLRPYRRPFDNAVAALSAVCGVCGIIFNYVGSWGSGTSSSGISAVGGGLVAAVVCTALLVFLYLWRAGHLPPVPAVLAKRCPCLLRLNKHSASVAPAKDVELDGVKSENAPKEPVDEPQNSPVDTTPARGTGTKPAKGDSDVGGRDGGTRPGRDVVLRVVRAPAIKSPRDATRIDAYADEPTLEKPSDMVPGGGNVRQLPRVPGAAARKPTVMLPTNIPTNNPAAPQGLAMEMVNQRVIRVKPQAPTTTATTKAPTRATVPAEFPPPRAPGGRKVQRGNR